MSFTDVYLALGGNIGDTYSILKEALSRIQQLNGVKDLQVSNFYITTPVSSIPQKNFLNAVCYFKTTLTACKFLELLQRIEVSLGKEPKLKEAPRIIDLDILFYGLERYQTVQLEIPHPRWMERLFVLIPLADLIHELVIPDSLNPNKKRVINIPQLVESLSKKSSEVVIPWQENLAM